MPDVIRTALPYVVGASVFLANHPAAQRTGGGADPYAISTVCFTYTAGTRQVRVATGDELQNALDLAAAGDTIVLTAGAKC